MRDRGKLPEIGLGLNDPGIVVFDIERDLLDLVDKFFGLVDLE